MSLVMLAIKLQRIGKKKQPSYRIVVAEKRSKLGAPPTEDLGSYNTITKQGAVDKERIQAWIAKGAQPTPTVHNLLIRLGASDAAKVKVKTKKPPVAIAATQQAVTAPQEEPAPAAVSAEAIASAPSEETAA